MPTPAQITRLAPSPTGALHLGNARTFLINWLLARQLGWRILLRIDDLDGPRIKPGADKMAIDDLRWLGLDWDDGPVRQSERAAAYQAAIDNLLLNGHAYPCICTRSEIDRAASAPHAEDGASVYPGTCRGRFATVEEATTFAGRPPAIRLKADGHFSFHDRFAGRRQVDVARDLGDFVIAKADGTAAYHLATVVDDYAAGVTQIVRGDDLLDSVPRQLLLYNYLGWLDHMPTYTHVPLILGEDGRRLAKRHGDTRLVTYLAAGVSPDRIRALLGRWLGLNLGDAVSIAALLEHFRLAAVPREPITFTAADEAWLRIPVPSPGTPGEG